MTAHDDAEKNRGKVRYAVVGAGNIAQVAVLPAFEHARENSRLVAVISGDPEKRATLRERFGLELEGDYADFESILEDGDIDAVYIATPNAHHKEFAIRAAEQSVHVLCEKPLAPSAADCLAITKACAENQVRLMVAYRLHFEKATLAAIDLVRAGKLGRLRLFNSFFSHVVREGDIRRDPQVAGGAALDLGVYCINAARHLFDAEPVWAMASMIEQNGTDDTLTAILRFPDDRLAQFCISNSVAGTSSYEIGGSKGHLRVEPGFDYVNGISHYLTLGDKEAEHTSFPKGDQFAPELSYFSDCILNDHDPEPSGEEGWCDVRVVEALLESARMHLPVELPAYERQRRPSLSQAKHAPPIRKQETVHAPGPSVK
jgi:predicted dehydrogenase